MREIKFRGKRKDNGEWVVGYYHQEIVRNGITGEVFRVIHWIRLPEPIVPDIVTIAYEVLPESVGEWSGLKDKNGKEIFENDVVSGTFTGKNFQSSVKGIVTFEEGVFGVEDGDAYSLNRLVVEVLGNLIDNPELLESKQ